MNVLIACERSGVLREAFRRRGHNAYSCDMEPADDASPYHIHGDALGALAGKIRRVTFQPFGRSPEVWDLVIAHPPCTRLCNSGVLRLYKGGKFDNGSDVLKWDEMNRAALFFRQFFVLPEGGPRPKLCVENPVQHCHALEAHACGKPTQTIQPYDFGEDASKRTALWLRGLPRLTVPDNIDYCPPRWVCKECGGVVAPQIQKPTACPQCDKFGAKFLPRWANQTNSGQNKLGPSPDRGQLRAKTYSGIAAAMVEQWGT